MKWLDKIWGMINALVIVLHNLLASDFLGATKGSFLDLLSWTGAIIIVVLMIIIPLLIARRRWRKHRQDRLYRLAKKHPRLARIIAFLRNARFTARYAIPEGLAIARQYWEMSAQTCNKEINNALIAIRTEAKKRKIQDMEKAKEREKELQKEESKTNSELAKLDK